MTEQQARDLALKESLFSQDGLNGLQHGQRWRAIYDRVVPTLKPPPLSVK